MMCTILPEAVYKTIAAPIRKLIKHAGKLSNTIPSSFLHLDQGLHMTDLHPVLVYFNIPAVLKCPTLCPRCPSHVPMSHCTNTAYIYALFKTISPLSPLASTLQKSYQKSIAIDYI